MKIKTEHLEHMKTSIESYLGSLSDLDAIIATYERGEFPRADKVRDLQQRFCFDLLGASGLLGFICSEVYPYANDSHVYTALKAICPKVVRKY